MQKLTSFIFCTFFLLFISLQQAYSGFQLNDNSWKAGVSRVNITPEKSIWLAGYASRDHACEGVLHEIWAKALALEDVNGHKGILVTTDLLGFPKEMSDRIRQKVSAEYGIPRSAIILSSSHTHSAPVLMDALFDIYPFDDSQLEIIKEYSDKLEKNIVQLAGNALRSMAPAQIHSQNGVVRFQVNRRNNNENTLSLQTELNGPNDYSVPVIKVSDPSGKLQAIVFGYACHATVLGIYQVSGDYPGFAQIELEKLYPGVTAMFFQGAGADQNPIPRRTIFLAKQYGKELAAAVERVLSEDMKKLEPELITAYSETDLPFSVLPAKEDLIKVEMNTKGYQKRWASNQIKILEEGKAFMDSYPYPVQFWKLGEQLLMVLGGELVIQYAIELKKIFGQEIFVMGYANDVMAYIPSEIILQEGGYEGESSHMVYGLPAKWKEGIETNILEEFKKLGKKYNLTMELASSSESDGR